MLSFRRHKLIRALTVFLAAYMLLASGRELIPGMCATLAALQTSRNCDTVAGVPSCCSIAISGNSGLGHISLGAAKKHPECAFCLIAKALVTSEAPLTIPGAPVPPLVADCPASWAPACALLCAESRPRDPPFTFIA